MKKKKQLKFTVVKDSIKSIIEFECNGCGEKYNKETYVPTDKANNVKEMKKDKDNEILLL